MVLGLLPVLRQEVQFAPLLGGHLVGPVLELVLGVQAGLDAPGQVDLLRGVEQRDLADLLEVVLDGVGRGAGYRDLLDGLVGLVGVGDHETAFDVDAGLGALAQGGAVGGLDGILLVVGVDGVLEFGLGIEALVGVVDDALLELLLVDGLALVRGPGPGGALGGIGLGGGLPRLLLGGRLLRGGLRLVGLPGPRPVGLRGGLRRPLLGGRLLGRGLPGTSPPRGGCLGGLVSCHFRGFALTGARSTHTCPFH